MSSGEGGAGGGNGKRRAIERAAIKVQVPAKPDFYRDSIVVERISSGGEPNPEEYPGEVN